MNDQDTKTEVKAHTRKRQQASTITRPPSARKHQADRTAPDKHQPTGQPFRPLEPILFPKLRIYLQGSNLNICYYHYDLH
uniref:Uncharacterized protein n=1 Tax=Caenorhabditis japonica TaxID=281687 RepID=K7HGS8_CAEJA